ncbi:glycosyltransferase family 61 protein [Sphingobium aromaticiconvertens]|uniref:glycosyltransferase family 61 protein n=1 Tax=Sphingobium aromaticiconvertens TaxID=365341 RepID=UPI003019E0E4
MGITPDDVMVKAVSQWDVAPAGIVTIRPAKVLSGQIDRIRGAEFGSIEDVVRDFIGGFDSPQPPTRAFRLTQILLMDGALYAGNAVRHLKPRSGRFPMGFAPRETACTSMYESWVGNRWFGNWLLDDCLTYRLAEQAGRPVATTLATGHQPAYERQLGIEPTRKTSAFFEELILFDDRSHNEGKRDRATNLRRRLIGSEPARHPGVYLLRGSSGARRVLRNERTIAEHLATRRGFQVLDPTIADLETIVRACAGADVIAGVEGSHLVHGLMMMPPSARALVIQPPGRAVSVLKLMTDRQGQDYSFVVGVGNNEVFDASVGEIERTLDLA